MDKSLPEIETECLAILHQFLAEWGEERTFYHVTVNTSLERKLGIDSISRMELLHRIENHFAVTLPDALLARADTLKQIIAAIPEAKPIGKPPEPIIPPALEMAHVDPSHANTLLDILFAYAISTPQRPHLCLQNEKGEEEVIRYGELLTSANDVAGGLSKLGLKPRETVAIMVPTGKDFFFAFFGILLAGGIPVPIYPPYRADRISEYAIRESAILRDAQVRILITFHGAEIISKLLRTFAPDLMAVTTVERLLTQKHKPPKLSFNADDPALIQYTSGSTSDPKGVLLTHRNLLANIRAYGQSIQIQPDDSCVSWLPLYHDMGLIGAWLGSFYYSALVTIMSPLTFLARPERWLWAIHYHRATMSAGPNFAYELCINKIPDAAIEGLDLSSWRVAFNGAESANPNTLRRFAKRFAAYGFREESLCPVYGLAESSVALAIPPLNRKPRIDMIAREPFEREGKAIAASSGQTLEFAACGPPIPGHAVRVVDDEDNVLEERHVGNLQFQGPSTMQGYYRNSAATIAAKHGDWWETGDLAYLAAGEVIITGRKKDIIIKAGRNFYPEEIEAIAGQVNGIRKGCVVAFAIKDPKIGTERLVVVAETRQHNSEQREKIHTEMIEKVVNVIGVPPDQIVLVPPRTIPKTSSGKLRRSSTKADYLAGKIGRPALPAWVQMTKLFLDGIKNKLFKWLGFVTRILFNIYLGIAILICLIPGLTTVFMSSRKNARQWIHFWTRLLSWIAFCPVAVVNKDNIVENQPIIYIANHASYIDALILLAILPIEITFVVKKELQKMPLIGRLIDKLGYLYVDRDDFTRSLAAMTEIEKSIQKKQSIVIFPEGTFVYTSGLRPFKSGAFKVASETITALCPISIHGSRHILRSESFLLSPRKITLTIGELMIPKSNDWQEVIRLRDLSRNEIAKHCGESKL